MELLAILAAALVGLSVLAIAFGRDSRPLVDPRPWWPGARSEDDLRQHRD